MGGMSSDSRRRHLYERLRFGLRGNPLPWSRYRQPSPWIRRQTVISGRMPLSRTRDIISERRWEVPRSMESKQPTSMVERPNADLPEDGLAV